MSDPAPPVAFREALRFWWKLGWIGFGGPAGQIATLHRELVVNHRWISERRFQHALNYCVLLPGPEAQQLATYLGWLMHRTRGGVAAGALFVLPSLLILIGLSALYTTFGSVVWVKALFDGTKPVVVAILAHALIRMGSRVLGKPMAWVLAGLAWIAVDAFGVPYPAVVAAALFLGWIIGRARPSWLAQKAVPRREDGGAHEAAWIDDDTPTPAHARWSWRGALRVTAACLLLWAVPLVGFLTAFGPGHPFTVMGWFFTKAALVTFGGGYAVLSYVEASAVGRFGWLSRDQMMDGLALGESTPGPLIMVLAFVGFLGGWNTACLGENQLMLAGVTAAVVTTWFTFLPSFFFILAGAPLVEATRGQERWHAPLAAVSAVAMAVIARLALRFGDHAFRPDGNVDVIAIGIAVVAWVALARFRVGLPWLVAAGAVVGILRVLV